MKLRIRHILVLIVLFVVVKTTRSLLYPSQDIATRSVHVDLPDTFSHQTKEAITNFCNQMNASDIPRCHEIVMQQFPVVSRVEISRYASGSLSVRCQADEPMVIVPEKGIVTVGCRLVSRDCYDASLCAALPVCTMASSDQPVDTASITNFFSKLPQELKTRYAISWHNHHEILLHQVGQEEFLLIVTPDQMVSVDQVHLAESLLKEYKEQKNTTYKGKQFIADLRFDHRIILHERAKGA